MAIAPAIASPNDGSDNAEIKVASPSGKLCIAIAIAANTFNDIWGYTLAATLSLTVYHYSSLVVASFTLNALFEYIPYIGTR